MTNNINRGLRLVASAYAAGVDTLTENQISVGRMAGGANNALYRIKVGEAHYACKLCVEDSRHRAAHEYGVMRLLQKVNLDIAPEPLWLDQSCTIVPFPVVVYRWLPGNPLALPFTRGQLAMFLDSLQRIHAIRPGDVDSDLADSWWHWYDFSEYLAELEDFLDHYGPWLATTGSDGRELRDRMSRLVDRCRQVVLASRVNPSREHVTVGLCRVDANLANTVVGPDGCLRWVDWEYGGWGDLALDLADMRWHAALDGLSAADHAWLRNNYRPPMDDAAFNERLAVWDRIIVVRWAFLILRWFWSLHHGPDRVRLTRQTADPVAIRSRLAFFVERAESLKDSGSEG